MLCVAKGKVGVYECKFRVVCDISVSVGMKRLPERVRRGLFLLMQHLEAFVRAKGSEC